MTNPAFPLRDANGELWSNATPKRTLAPVRRTVPIMADDGEPELGWAAIAAAVGGLLVLAAIGWWLCWGLLN